MLTLYTFALLGERGDYLAIPHRLCYSLRRRRMVACGVDDHHRPGRRQHPAYHAAVLHSRPEQDCCREHDFTGSSRRAVLHEDVLRASDEP